MKKFSARITVIFVALATLLQIGLASPIQAATGGSGYKVFPIRTDINVSRGTSQTVTIYVQNVSGSVENIQTIFNDFVANPKENGSPDILLNGATDAQHGLKQFTTFSPATFTLQPQATQTVKITVSIPSVAAPGGYYGAVRFAPESQNGKQSVNLSASVASLILAKVPGNFYENMTVTKFSAAQKGLAGNIFTSSKNLQAITVFQNNGQAQEEPFGKVVLLKGNKQIGTFVINSTSPPGNVLPNSSRSFTVNINGATSFGEYTLLGNFGYGSKGQSISVKTTFWVVPFAWIVVAIVVLVLLVIVLLLWLRARSKKTHRF